MSLLPPPDPEDVYRRPIATLSPLEAFAAQFPPGDQRDQAVKGLVTSFPAAMRDGLRYAWTKLWARPSQRMPEGDWQVWMVRAGRGFGKTRSATEGVRKLVRMGKAGRVALIGPTAGDVRDVMVEGESGILAVHPPDWRPVYEPSKRRLTWPNGAIGTCFSAEEPDRLRGPQSDLVWGDEPASWKTGSAAWDNASLGNRLGQHPYAILTGTPRPIPWLRELEAKETTYVTTGATYENEGNLAESFMQLILERYEGTRLGRQELHALYLDDTEGALWTLGLIELGRFRTFDLDKPWLTLSAELMRQGHPMPSGNRNTPWVKMMAVDPPGMTAECGIIVGTAPRGARAGYDHAVILEDASMVGTPEMWGAQVVATARKWGISTVFAERNQGQDMVRSTIHNVDPTLRVELLNAKENKYDRAEPVSVLYARGWVHHLGYLPKLEDQMSTWVPKGNQDSPDRMDAAVHLLTKLLKPIGIIQASTIGVATARRLPLSGGPVGR